MSSHNDIDGRFDDLVRELRSGRDAAPAELRERVRAIVAEAPERKPQRAPFGERFRLRRAALVLVPVCVVAATSAALVHGLASSGSKSVHGAVKEPVTLRVRGGFAGKSRDQGLPQAVPAPSTW